MKSLLLLLLISPIAFADCPSIDNDADIESIQFETGNETGNYQVTYTFPKLKELACKTEEWTTEFDLANNPIEVTYKKDGEITQTDRILFLRMTLDKDSNGFGLESEKGVANILAMFYSKSTHKMQSMIIFAPFRNFQLKLRGEKR